MTISARMRTTLIAACLLIAVLLGGMVWTARQVGSGNSSVIAITEELASQNALDSELRRLRTDIGDATRTAERGGSVPVGKWRELRVRIGNLGAHQRSAIADAPDAAAFALRPLESPVIAFVTAADRLVRETATDPSRVRANMPAFLESIRQFETARSDMRGQLAARALDTAVRARNNALLAGSFLSLAILAVIGGLFGQVIWIQRRVIDPIKGIATTLEKLSAHETVGPVDGIDRTDEVGALARGVVAFRQLAIEYGNALHRVEHVARHDTLTGLPNRFAFEERLAGALEAAQEASSEIALFFLDIDHFKDINDSLGHGTGDEVLRDVAELLRETCGEDESIGRIGGDEFAIVQTGRPQPAAASKLADRLLAAFQDRAFGNVGQVGASIGIAVYPRDAVDVSRLRHNADVALYRAKQTGRARACQFGTDTPPETGPAIIDRSPLSLDLPEAMAAGQLRVVYQPKLRTRTNRIDGCEALVRWEHPTRGLILPDRFVPIAERIGVIRALTEWTLTQVVADQARLTAQGLPTTLYANVSGALLGDAVFARRVMEIVDRRVGVIGLEITETGIIGNYEQALRHLQSFVDAGLRIAIDDYGSGMSSLGYLKQLPAHELKIDRAFISRLTRSHRDPLLVRSTIDLAHALGLEVTAEGVDKMAALNLLKVMGCDLIQGYLIAEPMPVEMLADFLSDPDCLSHLDKQPILVRN